MLKVTKVVLNINNTCTVQRNITLSAARAVDQKWREDRGLPKNPNSFGPLTNFPDYTFLDGRPTPFGSNQTKRLMKQQEMARKVVEMLGELDFAKERHARLKAEAEAEKQKIIQNKLKPKGHLLLKKK